MRKFYCLFILVFSLFIPKVYAFTYDFETEVLSTSSSDESLYEIKVSLKDVIGSDYGIVSCSLNILFHGDVKLNSAVKSLESWTLTTGKFYLFNTGSGVQNSSELFIIPVKVNGSGNVELSDIECFDDINSHKIDNKVINLKDNGNLNNNSSNSIDNSNSNDDVEIKYSNSDLTDIILSEGKIDFDPSITEYYIKVSDLDTLMVEPIPFNDDVNLNVDKIDGKVVISVIAEDGTKKIYTLYVNDLSIDNNSENSNDNNYVPIFIGIICILVLINIFRIVKNIKK